MMDALNKHVVNNVQKLQEIIVYDIVEVFGDKKPIEIGLDRFTTPNTTNSITVKIWNESIIRIVVYVSKFKSIGMYDSYGDLSFIETLTNVLNSNETTVIQSNSKTISSLVDVALSTLFKQYIDSYLKNKGYSNMICNIGYWVSMNDNKTKMIVNTGYRPIGPFLLNDSELKYKLESSLDSYIEERVVDWMSI